MSYSPNFAHLASDNSQLARLGTLAEGFLTQDPNTCLIKLRQFGELLAQQVAAKVGIYTSSKEEQYQLLKRLQQKGLVNNQAGQLFHSLRLMGNEATHKHKGDYQVALLHLKYAHELANWYYRSFSGNQQFVPQPFIMPTDSESQQRQELEDLLKETEAKYIEAIARLEEIQANVAQNTPQEIEQTIVTAQQAEKAIPNLFEVLTGNLEDNNSEGYENINFKLKTVTTLLHNIATLIGDNQTEEFILQSGEKITPGLGLQSDANIIESRATDIEQGIFKLLVMGEFKHGKSTLLNAILGQKKLPAKTTPATAVITILVYGNNDKVAIYELDKDTPTFMSWESFVKEFQLNINDVETLAKKETIDRFKNIKFVQIEYPHFLCQSGVKLIDSPGLAENISRTRLTTEFLKQAQAVMFILNAKQPLSQDEREMIESNFRPGNCNHIFFVVNYINHVDYDEIDDVKSYFRGYIKHFFVDSQGKIDEVLCDRRLFFVNAKAALDGRLQQPNDVKAIEASGVPALEKELELFLTSSQRLRAALSSTLDFVMFVIEQIHRKVAQRKQALDEPLFELQKRELESKERLTFMENKTEQIKIIINRYSKLIENKLAMNLQIYINELNKTWLEDYKEFMYLEDLTIFSLGWALFDENKKIAISKDINEGARKYLEAKLKQWSETIPIVVDNEFKNLQQEINLYLKEFVWELSRIEKMFSEGDDINVLEEINQNQEDKIVQLIISMLMGDFSRMAGTVMGDGSWGSFLKDSIIQIFLVSGILSFFGGPIEWIVLIFTEIVMLQLKQEEKQQKMILKIGEKIFEQLKEKVPEMEWRIREITHEQFEKLANQITNLLQEQINEVRLEQEKIIEQKQNTSFSIEEEKARLDKIEAEVIEYFNQISMQVFGRIYTIEEIEWLATGKKLMNKEAAHAV